MCQKIQSQQLKYYFLHLHELTSCVLSMLPSPCAQFGQTSAKFRRLKWFTYPRGQGKLLGKVLHLCRVDLVVKVDKIAPLLLKGSWIMCGW